MARVPCPSCKREKAMAPGKDLTSRNWPGSLCRFCTHFVPDVLTERYEIKCQDCGKSIGTRSFERYWQDLDEGDVQTVLKLEAERARQYDAGTQTIKAAADGEKDPKKKAALNSEVEARTATGLHQPRDFRLPPSWQKRHEERRGNHFCGGVEMVKSKDKDKPPTIRMTGCHGKRREKSVDFEDAVSHVAYEIPCSVCKKTVAWNFVEEHHPAEIHEFLVRDSVMSCSDGCAEKEAEIKGIVADVAVTALKAERAAAREAEAKALAAAAALERTTKTTAT